MANISAVSQANASLRQARFYINKLGAVLHDDDRERLNSYLKDVKYLKHLPSIQKSEKILDSINAVVPDDLTRIMAARSYLSALRHYLMDELIISMTLMAVEMRDVLGFGSLRKQVEAFIEKLRIGCDWPIDLARTQAILKEIYDASPGAMNRRPEVVMWHDFAQTLLPALAPAEDKAPENSGPDSGEDEETDAPNYFGYLSFYLKVDFANGPSAYMAFHSDFITPAGIEQVMKEFPSICAKFYAQQAGRLLEGYEFVSKEDYEEGRTGQNVVDLVYDQDGLKINAETVKFED